MTDASEMKEVKFQPMSVQKVLYDVDDGQACGGTDLFFDDYAEIWVDNEGSIHVRVDDEIGGNEQSYVLTKNGTLMSNERGDFDNYWKFLDPRKDAEQFRSVIDCFEKSSSNDVLKTNIGNAKIALDLAFPRFLYSSRSITSRRVGFGNGYVQPTLYGDEISFGKVKYGSKNPDYLLTFSGELYYWVNSFGYKPVENDGPEVERFKQELLEIIQTAATIEPEIKKLEELELNQPGSKLAVIKTENSAQMQMVPKPAEGI